MHTKSTKFNELMNPYVRDEPLCPSVGWPVGWLVSQSVVKIPTKAGESYSAILLSFVALI